MARKSPARGFKPEQRKSPSPFGKIDDINSLKFEGYRPATVQELIEKRKVVSDGKTLPSKGLAGHALLPDIGHGAPVPTQAPILQPPRASPSPVPIKVHGAPHNLPGKRSPQHGTDPMSGATPMGAQDTVSMLEQLDGPSRDLPSGARASQERPSTGQETGHTLNAGYTSHGIPHLLDDRGGTIEAPFEPRAGGPSLKGGPDQLMSFGITKKRSPTSLGGASPGGQSQYARNHSAMGTSGGPRSPGRKMKSPPRLRQAITGTPFTASRPDQPYFPFLLANLGVPRMSQEREFIVKDQLKDYAMLAVAWQRSRAGTTGSGKTAAAISAETKFQETQKKSMRRELKALHLGDFSQEPYRRTHVVDPSDAGLVFFKMATAYDELKDVKNALRCAKLYLNVCRQMGDAIGEALACNNIGVQYQALGGRKNLSKAVSYHSLHLQNGDDLGRFIAYLNLGNTYKDMAMAAQSREATLKALECAQRAYSAFGESIACAQLGDTLRHVGDPVASRKFLEKYLELSEQMADQHGAARAWEQLGSLQHTDGTHEDAAECYTNAYELARSQHHNENLDRTRALVGVTTGDQHLERELTRASQHLHQDYMNNLAAQK